MRSAALVDAMKMVIMMGNRMYVTVSSAKKNAIEPDTDKELSDLVSRQSWQDHFFYNKETYFYNKETYFLFFTINL